MQATWTKNSFKLNSICMLINLRFVQHMPVASIQFQNFEKKSSLGKKIGKCISIQCSVFGIWRKKKKSWKLRLAYISHLLMREKEWGISVSCTVPFRSFVFFFLLKMSVLFLLRVRSFSIHFETDTRTALDFIDFFHF